MIANKKTLNTANIQGLTNQNNTSNSAHGSPSRQVPSANDSLFFAVFESKAIFTLIAKFALAGYSVHKGQDGDFTVRNYCFSRRCQNSNELHDLGCKLDLIQLGGSK